jgi:protein-tyrosine phosphatase
MAIRSLLFVCKANQCRSPSAEAVMRHILAQRGAASRFEIDSAGTHEFAPRNRPLYEAHAAAAKRSYEIRAGRARRIAPSDFDHFDMILAMDRSNLADLRKIAPTRSKQKIELLLDYSERFSGQDVPDPVGGDARRYDLALDMIEDGCRGLAQLLLRAPSCGVAIDCPLDPTGRSW